MTAHPVNRMRSCAQCHAMYTDPHGITGVPKCFCSPECHRAAKMVAATVARAARGRLVATKPAKRQRAISPASPVQRQAISDRACIVCARHAGDCHPAHVIDRSLLSAGQDDLRAVVALCPPCHRSYDEGDLSLLEHLEPRHRDVLAFAVERHGLLRTLQRLTNDTWAPVHKGDER